MFASELQSGALLIQKTGITVEQVVFQRRGDYTSSLTLIPLLTPQAQRPVPSGGTRRATWLGPWCRGCPSPRMFWTVWSSTPSTLHPTTPPPRRASGTPLKVRRFGCHGSESKRHLRTEHPSRQSKKGFSGSPLQSCRSVTPQILKTEPEMHTKASTHVHMVCSKYGIYCS